MISAMSRRMFTIVAVLALTAMAWAQAPGKVQLKPQEPKARFIGTPKSLKSPNLEPAGSVQKPFFVPAGVTNLAKNKPVTSSDSEPVIGEAAQVTDGDAEGVEGSYVEFGPGTQWVQIDLQKPSTIFAIVLWHFHNEARVYKDVVIQVANDRDFTKGVQTIYNNDHDNSSGLGIGKDFEYIETNKGRIIDGKGVKGRFIRLYSKGNTANEMNHVTEVEVYGKAA